MLIGQEEAAAQSVGCWTDAATGSLDIPSCNVSSLVANWLLGELERQGRALPAALERIAMKRILIWRWQCYGAVSC